MRSVIRLAAVGLVLSLGVVEPMVAAVCPDDSVASGTVCIDKFEASVWHVPPEKKALIVKIQKGIVRLADLLAAGAVQLGLAAGDVAAAGCPATGNGCVNVYAVSIPGVTPAAFITWFQAAAAARNSLKRLPTNQEWQVATLGTPDGAPCNVGPGGAVANTGSEPGCVSDVGAFDLVGNVYEWVADWVPLSTACGGWGSTFTFDPPLGTFSNDLMCLAGASETAGPGALLRGGHWRDGRAAGVFAVNATRNPSFSRDSSGFRCAR